MSYLDKAAPAAGPEARLSRRLREHRPESDVRFALPLALQGRGRCKGAPGESLPAGALGRIPGTGDFHHPSSVDVYL